MKRILEKNNTIYNILFIYIYDNKLIFIYVSTKYVDLYRYVYNQFHLYRRKCYCVNECHYYCIHLLVLLCRFVYKTNPHYLVVYQYPFLNSL